MHRRRFFWSSLAGVLAAAKDRTGLCARQALVFDPSNAATNITVSKTPEGHDIRYVSGKAVYAEGLVKGRWVAHYWNMNGAVGRPTEAQGEAAFEIQIKDTPTAHTVSGKLLSEDWQWVSASELPTTAAGSRHFVVELSNFQFPIRVRLHTLVDGTPVLERWLQITNSSGKPVALTALSPWSGQLWPTGSTFTLGHSIRWDVRYEGWFGWTPLQPGTNVAEQDHGLAYDDPYFLLQNETRDEYFIGELAWPVNYKMEFQNAQGLSFKIGPTAINALRVIAPGETITSPSVHLGCVRGDFDTAVSRHACPHTAVGSAQPRSEPGLPNAVPHPGRLADDSVSRRGIQRSQHEEVHGRGRRRRHGSVYP